MAENSDARESGIYQKYRKHGTSNKKKMHNKQPIIRINNNNSRLFCILFLMCLLSACEPNGKQFFINIYILFQMGNMSNEIANR